MQWKVLTLTVSANVEEYQSYSLKLLKWLIYTHISTTHSGRDQMADIYFPDDIFKSIFLK